MGPKLAAYLVEHLPFEGEPEQQIETVRLVLQPGLLDQAQVEGLWRKAQRKPAYYVGFIAARPDDLPEESAPFALPEVVRRELAGLAAAHNAVAVLLLRALSAQGQAFVETVFKVFEKPNNQDVVNLALDCVAAYFAAARPEGPVDATLGELQAEAVEWLASSTEARPVLALGAIDAAQLETLRVMSGLSYGVVRPMFRDSTAIGSLMRRKLQPVLTPMLDMLCHLRAKKC
jgi:hypothetical protein